MLDFIWCYFCILEVFFSLANEFALLKGILPLVHAPASGLSSWCKVRSAPYGPCTALVTKCFHLSEGRPMLAIGVTSTVVTGGYTI